MAARYNKPGASAFGGNLVCASAALATLEFMEKNKLEVQAEAMGARLRKGLEALCARHAVIREVRGLGLMLGMELVDADGMPAGALADDGSAADHTAPGSDV